MKKESMVNKGSQCRQSNRVLHVGRDNICHRHYYCFSDANKEP